MRKKTRELLAVRHLESTASSIQATESQASQEKAEARRLRQKRMKDIRIIAKSQGLPAGFYRRPNAEEQKILDAEIADRKKTNEQKIVEQEQRVKDSKRIKKELKEISFEDMMFLARFEDYEIKEDSNEHNNE